VLALAELKIDIEASTNPKRIPATVDNTPAVVSISEWGIGVTYLLSNQATMPLITMLMMIFMSIIIIHQD
jgi:hypothetical protein